ncbi:MAG TPA: serine/threonine-protein kinase, partial [Nannocystaceae bacterium]|nr:serine/threonine-protein kinase [Nannocystaceae bacterium]
MGLVYSAYDAQLDRKIAIKIVKADRVRNESRASGAARLMREAQALARLSHPNVVPIYDVGVLGDRVWLALEYVEGWTVRQWLDRRHRHWRDILAVFVQAGRGLLAAHSAQLVHRDFKPDNVLVDRSGRARVTDFGLARVDNSLESVTSSPIDSHDGLSESLTRTGSVMGTPGYMAPEQHFGRPAEARSDQFAFCVALFEAVYGVRPFAGKTIREVAHAKWSGTIRAPKDFTRRPTGIPAALETAIRRGLAGEVDARWPTMGALVDELDRILRRPRTRVRIATVGVLAIVGAAWAWQSRPRECAPGRERLQGIWDDVRTTELGEAFAGAGTPAADAAWTTSRAALDRYAAAWTDAYDTTCTAKADRSELVRDAAMLCLQRRRGQLRAAVDALAQGDRSTVHRAADVVDGLEPIDRCLGAGAMQPRVPDDPELAAKVEATREHIANAVARRDAGQYATASELARTAAAEAEALDFAPLQIEADLALGVSLGRADRYDEGESRLVDAFHGAREQGLDEVALDAAIHLVFLVGVHDERWTDGLEWVRHGEAMQQRLAAEDPLRRARLLENRSLLFVELRRFDEAEAGYREALALRKELGSGERAIAMLHNNYGNMLASRRRYPEALAEHMSALELRIARLGRLHPEVAMSLINAARIHLEQYRYDEGLARLDEADPIIAATLGED